MAPVSPVLGSGLWLFYWLAARPVNAAEVADACSAVGAEGVVIHEVGTAKPQLKWLETGHRALGALKAVVGIGSRGPSKWSTALADPAIEALRAGKRVVLDWESAWDAPSGRPNGALAAGKILASVPDAAGRVFDVPWWAPLYLLRRDAEGRVQRVNTHPRAPTTEFGTVCTVRYPQCYPGVSKSSRMQADGAALNLLAWSRNPSQYPAMGTSAASVFGCFRGYARSSRDALETAVAEPHQIVYLGSNANRMTDEVRKGLIAARRVREAGGVAEWQRANGMKPDGIIGPKTIGSLGL